MTGTPTALTARERGELVAHASARTSPACEKVAALLRVALSKPAQHPVPTISRAQLEH